jgi:putative membrane protein
MTAIVEPPSQSYRTKLALDRTMLAWVRTAVNLAGFGFALVAFFRALKFENPTPEAISLHHGAITFGTTLILIGISTMLIAAVAYGRALRKLNAGREVSLGQWPISFTLALLVALLAAGGLWLVHHR